MGFGARVEKAAAAAGVSGGARAASGFAECSRGAVSRKSGDEEKRAVVGRVEDVASSGEVGGRSSHARAVLRASQAVLGHARQKARLVFFFSVTQASAAIVPLVSTARWLSVNAARRDDVFVGVCFVSRVRRFEDLGSESFATAAGRKGRRRARHIIISGNIDLSRLLRAFWRVAQAFLIGCDSGRGACNWSGYSWPGSRSPSTSTAFVPLRVFPRFLTTMI